MALHSYPQNIADQFQQQVFSEQHDILHLVPPLTKIRHRFSVHDSMDVAFPNELISILTLTRPSYDERDTRAEKYADYIALFGLERSESESATAGFDEVTAGKGTAESWPVVR